ncbi:hypothetical protein [Desulfomonile tiedjei]|uniref:Lipoprotein n=1 Tax=Desulfomonile tiedjei (strain ATCC 49306 / DSM 6799 / DCB-1) TaxID=706587 RepID=I4C7R4_DESTA|nr:hypothetical protein [Desulfomonile tiedjei]AFM25605.1 hypothetical protein Desti_2936 [Desulfomonile tiedjei DSM 6799]
MRSIGKGGTLISRSWILLVALSCCVFLASCVPSILSKKNEASAQQQTPQKGSLLKPQMASSSVEKEIKPTKDAKEERLPEKSASDTQNTLIKMDKPVRQESETGKSLPPPKEKEKEKEEPSNLSTASKKPSSSIPESPNPKPLEKLDEDKNAGFAPPLSKFDHAEYIKQVRSRAIDLINKEKKCSHAILCRDSLTDEWSVTLFVMKDKTFTRSIYVWDDIDEKWGETYSDPLPVKELKEALAMATNGKKCEPLKGKLQ